MSCLVLHFVHQAPFLVACRTKSATIRPSSHRGHPTTIFHRPPALTHHPTPPLKPTQALGLILWRAGILLVAGYFLFLALRFILHITDLVLEIGVSLVLAGALFVLVSVVREQIGDARRERSYEE